jgi:hypothetical protein
MRTVELASVMKTVGMGKIIGGSVPRASLLVPEVATAHFLRIQTRQVSRTKWMCANSCAIDGLPSIALVSSPASGKAWSRLSRMVLFRSQRARHWIIGGHCRFEFAFLQ